MNNHGKLERGLFNLLRYLLGDMKFLDKLINFNADAIDEKRFKKLRKKYLSIPELNS